MDEEKHWDHRNISHAEFSAIIGQLRRMRKKMWIAVFGFPTMQNLVPSIVLGNESDPVFNLSGSSIVRKPGLLAILINVATAAISVSNSPYRLKPSAC